jgi:hypothetical protein
MTGIVLLGVAGCDLGAPSSGSGAVVATDHLEKQRSKVEQLRAGMRARPTSKPVLRR